MPNDGPRAEGDALVVYLSDDGSGTTRLHVVRYDHSRNPIVRYFNQPEVMDANTGSVSDAKVLIDGSGDGVLLWTQPSGGVQRLYGSVYRASLGAFSSPALLDAGGDNVGATVLAALGDAFAGRRCQVLQVINPWRPDTSTVEGCIALLRRIETSARLAATGLIGNANLIDETTPQVVVEGYEFASAVGAAIGLPLAFVTVAEELQPQVDPTQFDCPVLTIRRQLVPPWKRACKL